MIHRMTDFMSKQADLVANESRKILEHEQVRSHWLGFACAILKRLGLQHPIRNMWEEALVAELDSQRKSFMFAEGEEEIALLWTLVDTIKARRPKVGGIIGDHSPLLVHHWTLITLAELAPDEQTKEALIQAAREANPLSLEIEHFPGNPLTIKTDPLTGEERLAGWENATVKHFTEMKSYDRARKPARPVGRPPGLPKPKKSGKPRLDPELGLRVHQCKLDLSREGKRRKIPVWEQIARQVLGIKNIPTDRKARDRLRKKIDALNALGARLYRKKSGK